MVGDGGLRGAGYSIRYFGLVTALDYVSGEHPGSNESSPVFLI